MSSGPSNAELPVDATYLAESTIGTTVNLTDTTTMGASQSTQTPAATAAPSLSEKQRARMDDAVTAHEALSRLNIGSGTPPRRGKAGLTAEDLAAWTSDFQADPSKRVIGTILSKLDLLENLTNRDAAIADTQVFNVKLSEEVTPVVNQKSSGRCWLFAATNVARLAFAKKYNVTEFQFSQSYLFFYDKLEKANYYLENQLELVDEPVDSRIIQFLNENPENDGGQWEMVVNLLDKYGLVPQSIYPESFHSSNSSKLNHLLTSKLREYSLELRAIYKESQHAMKSVDKSASEKAKMAIDACRSRKTQQMSEIYSILVMTLGAPPKPADTFRYEFYDKDKKFKLIESTSIELLKSLAPIFVPQDCISLINDPRNPLDELYTVQRLGNVWNARPVLYANTEPEVLEEAMIKMLKADLPIWFGCDVGKFSNTALGIMDDKLFDYAGTFGTKLGMTKAQRLHTGESQMTHAMVITAVHLDEAGKPVRWRVENSWSDSAGTKGYFVCTSSWFHEYAFQAVVPKSFAPKRLVKLVEAGKAVELPPWDPMGALA